MLGRIRGVVRDSISKAPIPDAVFYLQDTLTFFLTTDTNGAYLTDSLAAGIYLIQVYKNGYAVLSGLTVQAVDDTIMVFDFFLIPLSYSNNIYAQTSDGSWQPLRSIDNSLLCATAFDKALRQGDCYSTTTGCQPVLSNGFLSMLLVNPPSSGKTVHIWQMTGGAFVRIGIDFIRNGVLSVPGIPIISSNANFASTKTSIVSIQYINSQSDPTESGQILYPMLQNAESIQMPLDGSMILPSGTTLVVRMLNLAGNMDYLSLGITFWEETE